MKSVEERIREAYEPYTYQGPPPHVGAVVVPPSHPRRKRWAIGLSGLALVASLVILVPSIVSGPRSSAAAQEFHHLANAALNHPMPVLSGGEYWYEHRISVGLDTRPTPPPVYSFLTKWEIDWWCAADGSVERIFHQLPYLAFLGSRDQARWEAATGESYADFDPSSMKLETEKQQLGPGDLTLDFGAGSLTFDQLLRLPRDPNRLFEEIRAAAETTDQQVDYEMFVIVGGLLHPSLPSDLRGALFEVAAMIPNVHVERTTDPLGREVVAAWATPPGPSVREELLFDPSTGASLGEQEVLAETVPWVDAAPGTVIRYNVVTESGLVSSIGDRP